MKKSVLSKITVFICMVACCFMIGNIVTDYVLPIINGTISELPEGKVYGPSDVPDEINEFVHPETGRYAYNYLTDNEKEAYERLLMGICSFASRIDIKSCNITMDELRVIYSCMRNDYPELFWIYNNCEVYSSGDIATDCIPYYVYDKESVLDMAQGIETVKAAIVKKVDGKTDYEKVMYVFDYIIDNTDYDINSYNDYRDGNLTENLELSCSIYGTLLKQKALCEGYSKTVQYLLNSMGIDCLYITGKAEGEGHAWNYVKLDGSYYALDLTWCDPKSENETKSYAYCLVDYNTISRNHSEDVTYPLPECTGGKYNYYIYNGYELSAFRIDDLDKMFLKAYREGRDFVEIHCTTQAVYDSFMQAIQSQEIFGCFESIERYYGKTYDTLVYGVMEEVWSIRVNL
ncbi:MAG: transglutaminase domain-containing protein [Lachnospiraceae bacterium]